MAVLELHQKQTRFFYVYAITVFLCFSPFKSLSLVSPLLIIFLIVFYAKVSSKINLINLVGFFALYIIAGIFYFFINPDFLWRNFFFYVATHSSLLVLLISLKKIVDENLVARIASFTIKVLFFEAILGLLQVFYRVLFISHQLDGNTGDSAMGTVNPTFGDGDGLASNVYFAMGLSALGFLALVTRFFEKKRISSLYFGVMFTAWIFASVMHSIFLMLASVFFAAIVLIFFMPKSKISFFKKQLRAIKTILVAATVVSASLIVFLPSNVQTLRNYYEQTFDPKPDEMHSTKSIATIITIDELGYDKPYQKYIGLGPGQYTSRASLILSNEYLTSKVPRTLESVSPDLEKYILPIWRDYKSLGFQAGSTHFPFYSWLSLYGEWGLAGVIILLWSLFMLLRRLIARVSQANFYLVIGLIVITSYLFLLGVQDNYWEWSQFMLPIVIYAKVIYHSVVKPQT